MKNQLFRMQAVVRLLGVSLLLPVWGLGDSAPVSELSQTLTRLPGDDLKSEDIASRSDTIVIGRIVELGYPNANSTDIVSYNAKIDIIEALRGSNKGTLSVTIKVNGGTREDGPEKGASYIIFIKKMAATNHALKLLPGTDEKVAKVKALIAALPPK